MKFSEIVTRDDTSVNGVAVKPLYLYMPHIIGRFLTLIDQKVCACCA